MTVGPSIHDLQLALEPDVDDVPGPRSRRLVERQRRIESGAVLYPRDLPIALDEGGGAAVRDVDGNVYLDFFSGVGVTNVGHSNPYVVDAANEQAATLTHTLDFPTEARLDLIEKLDALAPPGLSGNTRVLFGGPTGSNAVEATIKLAKRATGDRGLLAFTGGFHGSTSGALSLSAKRGAKRMYAPLLPDVRHLPHPSTLAGPDDEGVAPALAAAREAVEDPYGGLADPAGIWVEPVQGEGGVRPAPEGFLAGLQEIAADNGIPLVVDEVQTGLGRTGKWFASEWYEVEPDVVPMAKALGGAGFPLSATLYDESFDVLEPGDHTGTFRGFLPAMRAGMAAIEYVEARNLLAHVRDVGDLIRTRLAEATAGNDTVLAVRGKGMLLGLEFAGSGGATPKETVKRIQRECLDRGVIVWTAGRKGSVLRLLPPLVLTEEQARVGTDIVLDVVDEVTG